MFAGMMDHVLRRVTKVTMYYVISQCAGHGKSFQRQGFYGVHVATKTTRCEWGKEYAITIQHIDLVHVPLDFGSMIEQLT